MDILLAEKLRAFRTEQGNTQEELARHLGISVQAVSKWERGEGYPDITLLPAIASYYGRTVDDLLGCGELEREKKIESITAQYDANGSEGRIEDNILLMRRALREFPNQLDFMSKLAESILFIDKEEHLDECIDLCEKILDKSTDDWQRYEALRTLVCACGRKDTGKAEEYAEKLPGLHCTRNVVLESVLEGKACVELAQQNIMGYIGLITGSIISMLRAGEYTAEETTFAYETVDRLYKLFLYDENYGFMHGTLYLIWMSIAKESAKCENREKTLQALENARQHAMEMDHYTPGRFTSMFMDTICYEKESVMKNFETSYFSELREELKEAVFDFVRGTERFQAIGEEQGKEELPS